MGNRIVANFKAKLGQIPSETEKDSLDEKEKKLLSNLRKRYKIMMDGLKNFPPLKKFKGDELISAYTELCLIHQYIEIEKNETEHFNRLNHVLEEFPIYTEFLQSIKGIGPAIAGIIVGEIDIHEAKYVTCIWKYAGLDVVEVNRKDDNGNDITVGEGRSRKKEHLREYEYIDAKGEAKTKMGITFNPFLKTKLLGVLGKSFLRCGKEHKYSKIYYDYKHRLENHEVHKEKTKGHRHNMAIRYMIKMFLADLYAEWRAIEGLEVAIPYHEAKLGLIHKAS